MKVGGKMCAAKSLDEKNGFVASKRFLLPSGSLQLHSEMANL